MGLSFAVGSLCFLVGPFPGYEELVGPGATAVTFFVGSIFFTCGGALQVWLTLRDGASAAGRAAWWAAVIQSAGTLFFNVDDLPGDGHGALGPDLRQARLAPRRTGLDLLPRLGRDRLSRVGPARLAAAAREVGMVGAVVNLLGCVFFGVSAIAGYVVPSSGSELDLAAANWTTSAGAGCFLACALAAFRSGRTSKARRPRRLDELAGA